MTESINLNNASSAQGADINNSTPITSSATPEQKQNSTFFIKTTAALTATVQLIITALLINVILQSLSFLPINNLYDMTYITNATLTKSVNFLAIICGFIGGISLIVASVAFFINILSQKLVTKIKDFALIAFSVEIFLFILTISSFLVTAFCGITVLTKSNWTAIIILFAIDYIMHVTCNILINNERISTPQILTLLQAVAFAITLSFIFLYIVTGAFTHIQRPFYYSEFFMFKSLLMITYLCTVLINIQFITKTGRNKVFLIIWAIIYIGLEIVDVLVNASYVGIDYPSLIFNYVHNSSLPCLFLAIAIAFVRPYPVSNALLDAKKRYR